MKCNWFQNTCIQTTAWSNQIVWVIIHCCSRCNCFGQGMSISKKCTKLRDCCFIHTEKSFFCSTFPWFALCCFIIQSIFCVAIWHIMRSNTFNLECSASSNKSSKKSLKIPKERKKNRQHKRSYFLHILQYILPTPFVTWYSNILSQWGWNSRIYEWIYHILVSVGAPLHPFYTFYKVALYNL